VKTSIIYPATEKHIAKFSQQELHIVLETPELYQKLTLPHLEKEQFNLQWVYNILEGKSEQDRVVYDNKCEKDGFVLVPDLKWDGLTKETLYLLAIVRRRGIKSLRDLDDSHLPLLKRVRDEGKKKIFEKYNVPASQLRVYLHYQPSFYHLHIHFTYLRHEAPGIYAEKSHLLDTVIDNIEMKPDYYQKATLPFTIREMDNIFNIYETNGHVQRIKQDKKEKMLIENVFIELRSRLRSCNVFITTGVDFTKNCSLKISIQTNCIVLNYYKDKDDKPKRRDSLSSIESLSDWCSDEEGEVSTVIPVRQFCKIIPNSMSCLKIDKSTISFRLLTEPKNGGNFYKELLSTNNMENSTKRSILKLNVKAGEALQLTCANCCNVVSVDNVKFDRILELPTANLDILTFFVVNNTILSDKTNKFNATRPVYHCNRCLAWLGLKDKDTVKLFNSEIRISHNDTESVIFAHKNEEDIHTDDFIYTIESMTREFNLGFQYTVMCKLVLECTVSAVKKQYLLIWVMDKELQVLRNNMQTILLEDRIELHSTTVTKILFKVEFCMNEEVVSWVSDPGVVTTEISKGMFNNGLAHLEKMSQKVPECFRNTNGYCLMVAHKICSTSCAVELRSWAIPPTMME
ncbi:hypothetical protein HW555_012281, partial [Spodoptera exigua]